MAAASENRLPHLDGLRGVAVWLELGVAAIDIAIQWSRLAAGLGTSVSQYPTASCKRPLTADRGPMWRAREYEPQVRGDWSYLVS